MFCFNVGVGYVFLFCAVMQTFNVKLRVVHTLHNMESCFVSEDSNLS